jgi:ribosome-associated toxin RatA of RatAB toxin-antitoxin module
VKQVKKSVLLWHPPEAMHALVVDVESYPSFLPWCSRAEVLERRPDGVTARLHLHYAGIRQSFTTRNVHHPDRSVSLSLVDGPFSQLEGLWRFAPITVPGGSEPTACRVEFELRYAFANPVLEAAISPVFDRIAETFVDSFVKRADEVHGERR